ncbi:DUF5658 family protein [Natronosalvus hydrolyticus]
MGTDQVRWHLPLTASVEEMTGLERWLWVVVGFSLVGDIVTTFVGLHLGLTESNPIARNAIDGWGLLGMLALKGFALGIALVCRGVLERPFRPIIPAALAIPWLAAVVINTFAIGTVLFY